MYWRVSPHSGIPLYIQITEQVKTAIATGVLEAGERLPTVRDLAKQLAINPNTVSRAYQELERAGLIETRPGRGTQVAEGIERPMGKRERERRLHSAIDRLLIEARALGFTESEVVAEVRKRGQASREGEVK